MTLTTLFFGLLLGLLLGWAMRRSTRLGAQPEDILAVHGPQFDMRTHLSGPMICEGVIYGPTGRVTSRFVADIEMSWDGDRGVMRERFRYDSGATQDREWRITLGKRGEIRAVADDVVGEGRGRQWGAAVNMRYRIRLPDDAGGHVLDTVDWMYLIENGTIINHSQFHKFGFCVAELVGTIRKVTR